MPILRQLHWLPIHDRIHHKVLSATNLSVHGNGHLYLSEFLHFYTPSHPPRSTSRSLLNVPRPRDSKTKQYGQRAFRYVAPSLWNALPGGIKESDSTQSFKASLKTHFFNCNWKPSQSWCWWCQCLHWWWYWWCVCVCSCKIAIMYVRFSPNLLCNMYVTLCMPMVPVWGFWSESLWAVLS